jgi:hypothetical protein
MVIVELLVFFVGAVFFFLGYRRHNRKQMLIGTILMVVGLGVGELLAVLIEGFGDGS